MEEDYLAQTSNRDIELVGESFMVPQAVTCGVDGVLKLYLMLKLS